MPRVSVWLVRSSLVALVVGLSVGGAMLAGKGLGSTALLDSGIPVHVELVLVGWMVQLAMGVALWILPRFGARGPGRSPGFGWAAWGLLNGGVALVVAGRVMTAGEDALVLGGRVCEIAAAVAFALAAWSRIRASGISAM